MKKFAVILLIGMLSFAPLWAGKEVLIKGSDTLLNLVQNLAEAYMAKHPGVSISVVGGGSGVGIAALIDGEIDIANASRKIKKKEILKAKAKGVNPVEFAIALDQLSVIVNEKNPVRKLTLAQIGAIFRGEIKNWKEVGGPDMKIVLYGRQPNSGTFVFFMEHVLKGDYSLRMRQMNGNAQIVEAVKNDVAGIGYVGVGYLKEAKGVKALLVAKDASSPYYNPLNPAHVEKYPITRVLHQYTNGKPSGVVKKFILFELSEEGQRIVEKVGFRPLPKSLIEKNLKKLR